MSGRRRKKRCITEAEEEEDHGSRGGGGSRKQGRRRITEAEEEEDHGSRGGGGWFVVGMVSVPSWKVDLHGQGGPANLQTGKKCQAYRGGCGSQKEGILYFPSLFFIFMDPIFDQKPSINHNKWNRNYVRS